MIRGLFVQLSSRSLDIFYLTIVVIYEHGFLVSRVIIRTSAIHIKLLNRILLPCESPRDPSTIFPQEHSFVSVENGNVCVVPVVLLTFVVFNFVFASNAVEFNSVLRRFFEYPSTIIEANFNLIPISA